MNVDGISAASQLQNQNSSLQFSGDSQKTAKDKTSVTTNTTASDSVQLQISIPRQTLDTLQKIGSITDVLNDTANSLRSTGNTLSAAADVAAKMRSTLENITKNFPPFPIDRAERKDILMSYISLRKQMEKMTVPAPPTPVYEKVKSLWQDLFDKNPSGTVSTPALDTNSSDKTVADASKQLTATGNAISTLHTAIGASL